MSAAATTHGPPCQPGDRIDLGGHGLLVAECLAIEPSALFNGTAWQVTYLQEGHRHAKQTLWWPGMATVLKVLPPPPRTRVTLHKHAPWDTTGGRNHRLRNGYRDRFGWVAGRYFKVSADYLGALWDVEEIDRDGEPLPDGFYDTARNLAVARRLIAEEVEQ